MSYLASFEGKYPKNLFNKSVVASDNQTLIGHVAKETNELIVVFSESDRKVRFDIPKSEITFTGSSVVMNNTADIQKYKVYRDTPLPQDNKSMIPTAAAQKEDVNQILSDESSSSNTKEKESSATTTSSADKLLLQQTSIRKEGKEEEDTAKIPAKTATKAKTKEAIPTTTAVPRSNYTTINKVQQEKIQQPGPIRATTTTTAQLPKEPSNATTTTIPEDRSSLTNKKEEEKQKEAIATSKKEEAIMPKVLAVPSEQATNETSRLMDKPPITKEESKISPASSSSTIPSSSSTPSSETTPTNVSVEKEPSEKIVEEEAVETAVEKAVTKAETEEAASTKSGDMKIQQQHQEQSREQGTKEQTLSHVETEEKQEEEETVPPNVEVTLKPPHNIEFSPPISAVNVPKALEKSGTSSTEGSARKDKPYFSNDLFPLTTIMALWQYSIIDGIDICNEFATNAAKAAEYWFDVFWNPAARRKEERKEKVVVR